jgi:hypothetical protein
MLESRLNRLMFALVVVLCLALGAQTWRVTIRANDLTQSVAVLGVCVADNERLQAEVDKAQASITSQEMAIGRLRIGL